MRNLPFFDANCDIGAPMNALPCHADTVADLYAEMDRMGVERALVKYRNVESGAVFANDRLAEMLEDDADRRLLGVWNILPEHCDELPHGDAFFDAMKAHRIVALRHLAGPQRWVPCHLTIGPVMEAARERRIPFLTTHLNYPDGWTGLYRFIQEFPENIFITVSFKEVVWSSSIRKRIVTSRIDSIFLASSAIRTSYRYRINLSCVL